MLLIEIKTNMEGKNVISGFTCRVFICGLLSYSRESSHSCGQMMALEHLNVGENDSQTNRLTPACVTLIPSRPQRFRRLLQNSSVGRRPRLKPRSISRWV